MRLQRILTFLALVVIVATTGLQTTTAGQVAALSDVSMSMQSNDSSPVPAEDQQDSGSLTISTYTCPPTGPDSETDPAECTEPAAGVEFAIGTPNSGNVEFGTTEEDGVISFALDAFDLSPEADAVSVGEVLASNPYGEVSGYTIACTKNDGELLEFAYEQGEVAPGGATFGIEFSFEPGDQISCDWFNTLANTGEEEMPATPPTNGEDSDGIGAIGLELRTWLCPTGIARDDFDFAVDCEDTPLEGVSFELAEPRSAGNADPEASSQTTDQDGSVQWKDDWLGEGVYTLQEDEVSLAALDVEIVDYVVRCSAGDGPLGSAPAEDYALSSVILTIPAETTSITCDWYNLPADDDAEGGAVTIEALACPEDYASTHDCTDPAAGETLDVAFGPTGGETTVETNDEGSVRIDTPAPSTALRLDGVIAPRLSCTDADGADVELDRNPPWFRATPSYVSLDAVTGAEISCEWYLDPPRTDVVRPRMIGQVPNH